ncbi:Forkhead-associated (FHA) domain [Macleaya cordata]|uniref:Forkhead-associated (FHA) domain n=1 Tax=Macleaya cordata TaxID=56857 RepID=A0A200QB87_MACCD|nr:Forkhead-associated (FHA) domain [Macleaya cordata]
MALEEDQAETPLKSKAMPSPKSDVNIVSQTSSCQPAPPNSISPPKKTQSPKEFILSVARKFSAQPLQNADPGVWGVLTAISTNARKRSQQGINILLTEDEHCIGRLVEDARFRIESHAVSGYHCKIFRKKIVTDDVEQPCSSVFLKDTSTNGTFLNWEKLKKNTAEAQLQNGDIVSFAAAPQHELAFAFVYREVLNSTSLVDGSTILKRKAEEFDCESKRLKGIGIGAPAGPISLDDVRSLQRSNTELRKQLESHVLTIEEIRNENRAAVARHEKEMKELKESVSQSYVDDLKDLRRTLEVKQKELAEISIVSAERQQAVEDLNERLSASMQSRIEAGEIINSQKSTISELEKQLDEERKQRSEEREKAVADLKATLQKAHLEAQEELKRQSDIASKQERELKEVINKLQESDKESRLLVETLRTKLEDTRESLVISEKKVRQLESQVQEEQQTSMNCRKKVEALEYEMKTLRKELENEKVAREEAWAKVSELELEIAAAIRDLATEKQRFQGARERIILRETQLRAFYSTTEEISSLFTKQQEQLKAMQRTLEDEENTSVDIDLIATTGNKNGVIIRENESTHRNNNNVTENTASASTPRVDRIQVDSTSDEASVTEKHECDLKSQEEGHNTQDIECTSVDRSIKGGFGSDIDGVGTAPLLEGDQTETQRVLGTESPANDGERNFDLNKSTTLAGETMQLDDEAQVQENGEQIQRVPEENTHCSQSNDQIGDLNAMEEDTEAAGTIRTSDLMTSEVAGSWAISTAPSVHGENDSQRSGVKDSVGSDDEADEDGRAAGSQIGSTVVAATTKLSQERQALNEMIQIVAPDFDQIFGDGGGGSSRKGRDKDDEGSTSDSATEAGSDHDGDVNGGVDTEIGGSISDTQAGSDQGDDDVNDAMDEDGDASEEDSVG